jgi:hypothetical protein
VDAVLLERADHLEARAVADVREARVLVAAEVALQDAPVGGAIEERAPLLELLHPVRRFHGVQLRHAPLVQVPPALHRVAEVDLPVVLRLDVAERRGDTPLGHHRVGLAEERLADQAHAEPHRRSPRWPRASPAPPAPMTSTSCSCVSYFDLGIQYACSQNFGWGARISVMASRSPRDRPHVVIAPVATVRM